MLTGSCLCGNVSFDADDVTREPAACHCTQCRKQSGHHWASVQIDDNKLRVSGEVKWYQSSPSAKRGFCPRCGSFLFWKSDADADTGVALGAMDGPTGLKLKRHIFTADQGDYYEITDQVRQEEQEDE